MDKRVREAASSLGALARGDLGMARLGCQNLGEYANLVAFHCQQAAEKVLKACLMAVGVEPPLTHSLRLLADLLKGRGLPPPNEDDARLLGAFAVGPRYGAREVSPEEALAAVKAAERVLDAYEPVLRRLVDEDEGEQAGGGGR